MDYKTFKLNINPHMTIEKYAVAEIVEQALQCMTNEKYNVEIARPTDSTLIVTIYEAYKHED